MSVSSVLDTNLIYTYPVPKLADTSQVIKQGSIKDVYEKYNEYFKKYDTIKGVLLEQLKDILEQPYTIEELDTDSFYTAAQKINNKRIDTDHCREGFLAYKFYLKEIATKIKAIDFYIKHGQNTLNALSKLTGSSEKVNDQAHSLITDLEIYDKSIYEELEEFLTYYKYNEDTKQWDIIILSVFDYLNSYSMSQLKTYSKNGEKGWNYFNQLFWFKWDGKKWVNNGHTSPDTKTPALYSKIQNLRDLTVETTNSNATNGKGTMKLTSFNSLTLFDRLRYIKWYYKLMFSTQEKIRGSSGEVICSDRFPDNKDTGYPCIPDVPSVNDTVATQSLGALELFYVGYLINRDGPINALSSFFEVKVEALRNNVSLSSKKIEALNLYLDFINEGLNQLNKNSGKRVSEGSIIALTYFCGQKMYNLFEDDNGDKWFVVPRINDTSNDSYFLIKADNTGKKFLLGDCDYTNSEGNSECSTSLSNNLWHAYLKSNDYNTEELAAKFWPDGNIDLPNDFKPTTQIECMTVAPTSVKNYSSAKSITLKSDSDNNVLGSWTDAFSRKTQFINTTIDTINTDVTLDRSKIDTFDSLTSTFRSRAQDTYQNILSNVR